MAQTRDNSYLHIVVKIAVFWPFLEAEMSETPVHDENAVHRHVDAVPIPVPLYVGISLEIPDDHFGNDDIADKNNNDNNDDNNNNGFPNETGDTTCRYGIYVHDGFWSYDYHEDHVDASTETMFESILDFLCSYQREKQCKIVIAGLVNCSEHILHMLGKKLWFELDIVPCILSASGRDLDEKACSAARKSQQWISPTGLPGLCKIEMGFRHEVEVDANGRIKFCSLDDYRNFFSEEIWAELLATSELIRRKDKRIVFFNSTPQGGGVAIIRHSTVRMFKMLNIDAHWFVMKPNPEVFEITKKKFHNVLQGVAPVDTEFTRQDRKLYEKWCKSNVDSYWSGNDSPLLSADMIVIDDPQPTGIIPWLKKLNSHAIYVYRSHIEMRSDLIRDGTTIQNRIWNYLWNNIRQCDVFVSHPVDRFVPDDVRESGMIVYKMPASTDPCDGLNKRLDDYSLRYYQLIFNRISFDQTERKVDFARPYFVQISRFDPSKGIPDLIDAYIKFRRQIASDSDLARLSPQLVITGHGSIDDPEGSVVYRMVMKLLENKKREDAAIVENIVVVRLGPSDQLLNAILQGATCAFQLSHREGFEIKVSEALLKGVPVVAYRTGGISLQIRDEIDGHLLPAGDVDAVAETMKKLYCDKQHLSNLKRNAAFDNREWILTPSNVIHWNRLMLRKNRLPA